MLRCWMGFSLLLSLGNIHWTVWDQVHNDADSEDQVYVRQEAPNWGNLKHRLSWPLFGKRCICCCSAHLKQWWTLPVAPSSVLLNEKKCQTGMLADRVTECLQKHRLKFLRCKNICTSLSYLKRLVRIIPLESHLTSVWTKRSSELRFDLHIYFCNICSLIELNRKITNALNVLSRYVLKFIWSDCYLQQRGIKLIC